MHSDPKICKPAKKCVRVASSEMVQMSPGQSRSSQIAGTKATVTADRQPATRPHTGRACAAGEYHPSDKLVRGLANTFTGIIEIPRNIYNTTRDQSLLARWTVELGKGSLCAPSNRHWAV